VQAPDFEAFYRLEFPRMVTLAAAMTGDLTQAEDIAQEALLAAQRRWTRVSKLDRPGAWVRRVTVNRATSQLRRRTVERAVLRRMGPQDPWSCETSGAALSLTDETVLAAIHRLPPRQRAAVVLAYVEDLPVVEIAEILDCAVGTVKSHLFKARSALARTLTPVPEESAR
jgi:RNA polymerase sigma-70 factor (ECF subfamily)